MCPLKGKTLRPRKITVSTIGLSFARFSFITFLVWESIITLLGSMSTVIRYKLRHSLVYLCRPSNMEMFWDLWEPTFTLRKSNCCLPQITQWFKKRPPNKTHARQKAVFKLREYVNWDHLPNHLKRNFPFRPFFRPTKRWVRFKNILEKIEHNDSHF